MIGQTWAVDTTAHDSLIEFVDKFDDFVFELGDEVFLELYPNLLDDLQYYPDPPPDSKYVRTYKLRNGWKIRLQRTGAGFVIVVENAVSYARYVVGSLAQALAAAAELQAWMHKGRWPLASATVTEWYEAFMEVFQDRFDDRLLSFGSARFSRRAVTSKRKPRRAA